MKTALFIFRRDLRLQDNSALNAALNSYEKVILAFIFTPEQIEKNPYKSNACLQFMIESLMDLNEDIKSNGGKLYLFYGTPESIVEKCIKNINVKAVFVNNDYTPYSLERDKKIQRVCNNHGIDFFASSDLLLHNIEDVNKKDGSAYTIFTPYFKNASNLVVKRPKTYKNFSFYHADIDFAKDLDFLNQILPQRKNQVQGGRKAALQILKNIKNFKDYKEERDFPYLNKTTHLSAHLKFNTCSTREIYFAIAEALGPSSDLLRSLYWRDFFTLIGFFFPHVFKGSFKPKYDSINWNNDDLCWNYRLYISEILKNLSIGISNICNN